MPSFEQDHFFLLVLARICEPQTSYSLDDTYSSIDQIADLSDWDESIDGATPTEFVNYTPWNWYTQYWSDCARQNICANLDGYEFQEICDYEFYHDETIYIGHFLDLY